MDVKAEIEQSLGAIDIVEEKPKKPNPKKDDASQAQIDEWTSDRIRRTVEAREFVQAQKVKVHQERMLRTELGR